MLHYIQTAKCICVCFLYSSLFKSKHKMFTVCRPVSIVTCTSKGKTNFNNIVYVLYTYGLSYSVPINTS